MKQKRAALVSLVMAGALFGGAVSAQTFTYSPGDLFVGFRTVSGPTNLLVDIGAPGSLDTSSINGALLTSVFGGLDGIYWSVFGYQTPQNTLWTTSARADIGIQTDPTPSAGSSGQGIVIGYMGGILNGTTTNVGSVALSSHIVETPATVNQSGETSYGVGVVTLYGPNQSGDFHGSWSPIENYTGSGFAGSGTPSVSDLYQNNPGNPLTTVGTYLGNFSLGNDGSLTFSPVPEPSALAVMGMGVLMLLGVRGFRFKK